MDYRVSNNWAPGNAPHCWRPTATVPSPDPSAWASPYPRQVSRGATAARAHPQPPSSRRGRSPPPQSHLSRARRLQPPGSRPHRTRWVPAQGEVCSHEGEGRGGSQGKRRERLPGVRTTLKGEERELREVKPYLPSRDPPLRVTRPAVHCGGQGVAFLPGSPASNVAGARRDQAPPPSLRLARANQVLWEGYADPPPPGGPM